MIISLSDLVSVCKIQKNPYEVRKANYHTNNRIHQSAAIMKEVYVARPNQQLYIFATRTNQGGANNKVTEWHTVVCSLASLHIFIVFQTSATFLTHLEQTHISTVPCSLTFLCA